MRILLGPDLHCWWNTYERNSRALEPDRYQEWLKVSEQMIQIASSLNVKYAMFPGDYFINSQPPPKAVKSIITLFQKFEGADIKVLGIGGNHDDVGPGEDDFVDVVSTVNPYWGITQPKVIALDEIAVIVMPFMKSTEIGSGTINDVSQLLINKAIELKETVSPDFKTILLGHWGTDQSVYANGFKPESFREPYLPLEKLIASGFDAVVLGHIHKPQVLSESPLILHTGVLTRGKCDEGKNPCGVFILDTNDWSYGFHELNARQITDVKINTEAMEDFESGNWLGEIPNIKDHIVTLSYTISEDKLGKINNHDIGYALYSAGAYFVEGIYPMVIRKERQRVTEVTEKTDEKESFSKWYDSAEEPPQLKDEVLALFEKYLAKAKED
jgi:exonuclease SbcD